MIKTIGCCDSGLGGMISVDALHKAYPNLNIVFIADQINSPYGEKTREELDEYAINICKTFKKMGIQDIVIACNTLCCNGSEKAKEVFPELTIRTIIEPTYQQLIGNNFKSIHVLATKKTVETHVYGNALKNLFPNALIKEIPASKLVPIIENGFDLNLLEKATDEYCGADADAWILGCTHYPLIRPFIKTKGLVFDSIQPIINFYKDEEICGDGKVEVYTTKDPQKMKESIFKILSKEYDVQYIDLKQS